MTQRYVISTIRQAYQQLHDQRCTCGTAQQSQRAPQTSDTHSSVLHHVHACNRCHLLSRQMRQHTLHRTQHAGHTSAPASHSRWACWAGGVSLCLSVWLLLWVCTGSRRAQQWCFGTVCAPGTYAKCLTHACLPVCVLLCACLPAAPSCPYPLPSRRRVCWSAASPCWLWLGQMMRPAAC